jgi:hypothetical protein
MTNANIDAEKKLLDATADLHNSFMTLPAQHPNDLPEWIAAIHALQRIIATRIARVDHPEIFYVKQS